MARAIRFTVPALALILAAHSAQAQGPPAQIHACIQPASLIVAPLRFTAVAGPPGSAHTPHLQQFLNWCLEGALRGLQLERTGRPAAVFGQAFPTRINIISPLLVGPTGFVPPVLDVTVQARTRG